MKPKKLIRPPADFRAIQLKDSIGLYFTDHGGIDYDLVVAASKVVVDARNATAKVRSGREKIVLA